MSDSYDLSVVELIRKLEQVELPGKGRLKLDVCSEAPLGKKAYVSFKPLTLHIERITFERARLAGDFHSKYVIAHELGHIILHDHNAKPFSDENGRSSIAGMEEFSAEWQAHRFAEYLLLPDHIVSQYKSVKMIVDVCNVSYDLAEARVEKKLHINKFRTDYLGEFCSNCQNACLLRKGLLIECDHCGVSKLYTNL